MSETRALLLTDVVDSTQLSESLGDEAMARVWAAHDRIARDLLKPFRGREIDKTDGMLLLFDTAADAVAYAQAYHRGLAALSVPLRARAGLHVGPVILRENSPEDVLRGAKPLEVDGLAKPTAARVMSLAQGGQTLLTADAHVTLGATALRVQSHGHWLMKGIVEPIELFEIGDDNAPFSAPPDSEKVYRVVRNGERWLAVRQIPNNLPQQTTSFIGRERELDEAKAALSTARLVTLLGMGGLGKTRLSLQIAAEVMHFYPDGAWFLDLSPIRDPALVVSEAAHVLGVDEEPGRPLMQSLCAHLKSRRVLLVMDNCEHMIQSCADLAYALLRSAPQVRILASSRELLEVPGEQAYPILPLPVPRRGDSVKVLARSTAVRLFVERARAIKPSFELNEEEAPALAELVARLEGIPLALELAAARVRVLSVADINTRLHDRYKLLTGGSRVLEERQQTLRALVDWSYDMLGEAEQTVLQRLGVFGGGFDLEAAEPVCGAAPIETLAVKDMLASLAEKSLLMRDQREQGTRSRMLETIREYAHEKLVESGALDATAARHCDHYFALAKAGREGLRGPQQAEWMEHLETDLDNLRGAMALALSGRVDAFVAVKLAVALQGFWILRGHASEGRTLVQAALALPAIQASDLAQAWALYVGAALATVQSEHDKARQMLQTCLALRRRLGNPVDIAATLSTLSLTQLQAGDAEGAAAAEHEALELFTQLGDKLGQAIGLLHLGQFNVYLGQDAQAQAHVERALALALEMKHREVEGECELTLGELALERGDMARAVHHLARSQQVCHEAGDKRGDGKAQWWLGRVDLLAEGWASAAQRLGEALRCFREFGMREELLGCLEDHAALAAGTGAAEMAVRLLAVETAARGRLRLARSPRAAGRKQALVDRLRAGLGDDGFRAEWRAGNGWEIDDAVKSALALPVVAT